MKTVKDHLKSIEPALLNIVNTSISTNTFPSNLKTQLIYPALKPDKDSTKPLSFRPINVIETIAKIIETVVKEQTMKYLIDNELIPAQHSGGIKNNSTATVAIQLVDQWSTYLESKQDAVNLQMDQTGAFEIVHHPTLLKKLQILIFNYNTVQWFRSYLSDRYQVVSVGGRQSGHLRCTNNSTIQGSVLSGLLYLLFILDYPMLFHHQPHTPLENVKCTNTTSLTFVDDINDTTACKNNKTLQQTISENLKLTTDYMEANKLALNPPKNQDICYLQQ